MMRFIYVLKEVNIYFLYKGKTEVISINDLDTIGQLYTKIRQKFKNTDKYLLINSRNEFLKQWNSKIMNYFDFSSNYHLEYVNPNFSINIRTLTGKTITFYCEPDDTILRIKEKFQNSEGVIVDDNRLIFDGRQLEDTRTISDYHIYNGATIYSVLRLRG